jgi:integrase
MTGTNTSRGNSACEYRISLLVHDWPEADRRAWEDACRPGVRLKAGGAASSLAQASRNDFAYSYGAFLGSLQRKDRLDRHQPAAAQVTPRNVEAYITELTARVSSVTVHTYVHHMRRVAELLAPRGDFSWLAEIEKDLALVMDPSSKYDRLVFSGQLVKAGLTLIAEAQEFIGRDLARALGIRNGLLIAILGFCPIRRKNYADLEIGRTFKEVHGRWWIALPGSSTKSGRPDERCIPKLLNPSINVYLHQSRPLLLGSTPTDALWISSITGRPFTKNNFSTLISRVTLETTGVDVSPHLFRTAAASTAAAYGSNTPHLASALLNHTDPRVTEEHYNRATSVSASKAYADIIKGYLGD